MPQTATTTTKALDSSSPPPSSPPKAIKGIRTARFLATLDRVSFFSIVLPLTIFLVARLRHKLQNNGQDGNGGNNNGYNRKHHRGRGAVIFVYLWTILLVIVVTHFARRLLQRGKMVALRWTLLGFANSCFICCVLLGGYHAVRVRGREIKVNGWYGQLSVLAFLTCMFNMFSGIFFALWTLRGRKRARGDKQDNGTIKSVGSDDEFYTLDDDGV